MGGVNRVRGVGDQLQGLSMRLDGRSESSERSGIHSSYKVYQ